MSTSRAPCFLRELVEKLHIIADEIDYESQLDIVNENQSDDNGFLLRFMAVRKSVAISEDSHNKAGNGRLNSRNAKLFETKPANAIEHSLKYT